jgi:hypothetical protein
MTGVHKLIDVVEDLCAEAGRGVEPHALTAAAPVVIRDPQAGHGVDDLSAESAAEWASSRR